MRDPLTAQIQQSLIQNNKTLSLAESCTGGALAARLTESPGCSNYFLGSCVVYSNDLKIRLLGVSEELLKQHGAVSSAVVNQMVKGVLLLTGSDYSIAVSGIAGPDGGTREKPVGTIWAAIGEKGKEPLIWTFQLSGTRTEIIKQTVEELLTKFCQILFEKK